ncbi:MAG: hypothetical protein ABUL72_05840, partial [Armatimonadota bacterium]
RPTGDQGGDDRVNRPDDPSDINSGLIGDPFGINDTMMQNLRRPVSAGSGATAPPPATGGGGPAAGGGGGGGGAAAPSGTATYTRWVYNKDNSKYAFVLDQNNRIIQIEALGIRNSKIRTKKGVTFGSSFAQIMNRYNIPEQYEFGGGNLVMKYLVKYRVVFRLAKLDAKKPHVVTGIVIAAGNG